MEERVEQRNLELLLRLVRRRWWLIALCAVVTCGATVAFSVAQRTEYTANASLLFRDPGFEQLLFGTALIGQSDPTRQGATNINLAQLPVVAAATSAQLGGKPSDAYIRSHVTIAPQGASDVATISATDPSPKMAARLANVYGKEFIKGRQTADKNGLANARRRIQQQLSALKAAEKRSPAGQSLINRANQLGVLASLQTGNAQLAQPAAVPTSPSSPKPVRNGIFGALVGLMIGFVLVLVVDRVDRRLRDATALEHAYGVPVLALVPQSDAYVSRTVPLPPMEQEAFALLRARLRYFNVDREIRSLLVTSAIPGEGKTTIALYLALADVMAGRDSVVLVEGDLRRPNLAKSLGIAPTPGLAELLSHSATLDEAVRHIDVPGRSNGSRSDTRFSVIPAGAVPPNPGELIESHSMAELLNELTQRYDLVVIDSPPVSVVSDAIPLMRQVSGVVIVSRIGKSNRDSARHLRTQLANLNAPTLGVVGNAISIQAQGYYGYGSEYYSVSDSASREASRTDGVEPSETVDGDDLAKTAPDRERAPTHDHAVPAQAATNGATTANGPIDTNGTAIASGKLPPAASEVKDPAHQSGGGPAPMSSADGGSSTTKIDVAEDETAKRGLRGIAVSLRRRRN